MTVLTFGIAPETYGAVEIARRQLEDIGLSPATIASLAEQRDRDLDGWDIDDGQRAREKALPEPLRALRRLQTLILNALQEDWDTDA